MLVHCFYLPLFSYFSSFLALPQEIIPLSNSLNGLLVIRQNDNISPGGSAPGGKLVPGSHKSQL